MSTATDDDDNDAINDEQMHTPTPQARHQALFRQVIQSRDQKETYQVKCLNNQFWFWRILGKSRL